MGLIDGQSFNIEPTYHDIAKFRATLGHKHNQCFKAKCDLYLAYHPRFGMAATVNAMEDIVKGEVNYMFANEGPVPQWYADLFEVEMDATRNGEIMGRNITKLSWCKKFFFKKDKAEILGRRKHEEPPAWLKVVNYLRFSFKTFHFSISYLPFP